MRVYFVLVLLVLWRGFGEAAVIEDMDLGGSDAGAIDFFDLEGGAEVKRRHSVVQDLRIEACVEEGTEEHVAGDAGEAVEVGEAHDVIVPYRAGWPAERS